MKSMTFQASLAAAAMLAAALLATPVSAQTQTLPAAPAQA
ncbi:tonB-system energizer ExbB, partial [Bradyrhizobium cajani]|nr:tonB-system energizer ExbB [Bradyrhizobium cajani]